MKKYSASWVFMIMVLAVAILFVALPKKTYSENEKKVLPAFPEITWDAVADGSWGKSLEDYLASHFPLRDFFVGVHAYWQQALGLNGNNGVYKAEDGYLITAPGDFDEGRAQRNLQYLKQFAQTTNLDASLMIVPSAGYILEDKLPKLHEAYEDKTLFSLAEASGLQLVDLRDHFLADTEDLYYRTDHHLTAAGSLRMYQQFCAARGITPKNFALAESYPGFYGTTYSKSGLWETAPDTLEIYKRSEPGQFVVTITEKQDSVYDSLYFGEHLENMDKYPVYLDGNHAVVTIENKSVENGKTLLLLKDSYAHCFATYLAEHYEKIVMVDMRYYRSSVQTLAEAKGATEILYLYGAENLASSTDLAWLNGLSAAGGR